MNTELERQQWREGLFQSLSKEGNTRESCALIAEKFDKLTESVSGETGFSVMYSAYGASDSKQVCRTVKDWIARELGEFNANHPGVAKDPLVRLRAWVKRFNESLDKCSVEIDGKPAISEQELSRQKVRLPGCLNPPTTYSCTASVKGKTAVFELDVSD